MSATITTVVVVAAVDANDIMDVEVADESDEIMIKRIIKKCRIQKLWQKGSLFDRLLRNQEKWK
jgi:hypothetical protein